MLGLTELDDMVCQRLSIHDLAQCARASKKWHSVVVPHLWRDLSWITSTNHKNRRAFCGMVREDYLAKLRCQEAQEKGDNAGEPSQAQPSLPSSVLSKNGHWIRKLPASDRLEIAFRMTTPAGKNRGPASHELLLHLFKRCSPHVQVEMLLVDLDDLDCDSEDPKKMILDFCLPRVRHLCIRGGIESPSSRSRNLMGLLGLLDRYAAALEILSLDIDFSKAGMIYIKEDQAEERPEGWTSLKELRLHKFIGNSDTNSFLPWLLRKCSSVKGLKVNAYTGSVQSLVEGMLTHLPNLDKINLGDDYFGFDDDMEECVIAQLLSGSSNGWKVARLSTTARFGDETMDALARHFSSLEILDMDECLGVTSDQLVQILGSCSRLHTLSNVLWLYGNNFHDPINAKVFADVDPETGSLRPWQCEKSLKVLKIKITGIPRTDLGEDTPLEAYPDQTRELHSQVYNRLARLTNLETWWLGNGDSHNQSDSLEMSLESGLDKLQGLTKLKELDVSGVRTKIGVKEAQWMSEYWPRLRAIHGLCDSKNEEALRWLQANRPNIDVK